MLKNIDIKNPKQLLSLLIIVLLTFSILFTFWAIKQASFDVRKRAQTIPTSVPVGEPKVICSIFAFEDDPRNKPPSYFEEKVIKTVQPGQTIVWGINFYNPSNYDFNFVKNFIFLGSYQNVLDSSSFECPYDPNSKSLTCTHGLFLHGGGSSMAIRTQFVGGNPIPVDTLAVSFTNIGTTGGCSYILNPEPLG